MPHVEGALVLAERDGPDPVQPVLDRRVPALRVCRLPDSPGHCRLDSTLRADWSLCRRRLFPPRSVFLQARPGLAVHAQALIEAASALARRPAFLLCCRAHGERTLRIGRDRERRGAANAARRSVPRSGPLGQDTPARRARHWPGWPGAACRGARGAERMGGPGVQPRGPWRAHVLRQRGAGAQQDRFLAGAAAAPR